MTDRIAPELEFGLINREKKGFKRQAENKAFFSTFLGHNTKTYLGTNVQLILKTISFHAASKTDPSLWSMQVW